MDPLEAGAAHQAIPQRIIEHRAPTVGQVQQGTYRPRMKDRHKAHKQLEEVIPINRRNASPGSVHVGQGGFSRGYSECRDTPNREPLDTGDDTQAGHSRDATAMATAFERLNRSLETFLTRLSRTNERSEKSKRVFKKPRCYKDESDGCIDTWIEVMKLHFEEEDLSERQECSALTSNLEGTALNCVMAKKQYQRDTAKKIFESC